MKRIISFLMLCMIFSCLSTININAKEEIGSIGIVIDDTEENLNQYIKDHPDEDTGCYVYVQNLDNTQKIYRFPLSKMNDYQSRFDLPYGNYRVVPKPNENSSYIGCNDVFAISENNTDISIQCKVILPEKEKVSSENITAQNSITATPSADNTQPDEGERSLPITSKISILIAIGFGGMVVYKKIIKPRR